MSSNSPRLVRSVIARAEIARFFKFVARGGAIRDRARRLNRVARRHSRLAEQWIFVGMRSATSMRPANAVLPLLGSVGVLASPQALAICFGVLPWPGPAANAR